MDLLNNTIEHLAAELRDALKLIPETDRIEALNRTRSIIAEASPFRAEPVDRVLWVPANAVAANDYNPNRVATPEMRLLERSIRMDGFTQPVVAVPAKEGFEIVDGFHRTRVGKECRAVRNRVRGYLPLAVLSAERHARRDRMAATIRHNRARGVHGVLPMTEVVAALIRDGWTDTEIAAELGMDADEVLRFKQTKGLPELFAGKGYSRSWE